ncbi:MAG: [LysW]-lysine hydrolase [Anaerolineae bacterium]
MDAVKLLEDMLALYSPSTREGECVAYLVEAMEALGFQAHRDEVGNAVGVMGEGEREMVLLGHVDTVEGFIPVRREGDRLYGRGAVDAKGPLAAFVAAVAQVGPRSGRRLVVVGAVEEEAATSKGARHVAARFAPRWAIVGEPSGWQGLTLGYKGRLLADYRLRRPASHSAAPTRGVCEEAVDFWNALLAQAEAFNRGKALRFETLDLSLRSITSSSDGFNEEVRQTIGWRLPPGFDVAALKAAVVDLAGGAEVRFRGQEPAFRGEKNTPLVRAFLQAIRQEGGSPRFKVKTGTSDMNVVGPAWGCPIVAYGPGDSTLDHTPHEHLDLAEYRKAIAVLARVLRQF